MDSKELYIGRKVFFFDRETGDWPMPIIKIGTVVAINTKHEVQSPERIWPQIISVIEHEKTNGYYQTKKLKPEMIYKTEDEARKALINLATTIIDGVNY